MLPLVIKETTLFVFKFWFNDQIQEGMHYQHDMFCRLYTVSSQWRVQLYQFGCKLTQAGTPVVISFSDRGCSLWVSLRSPLVKSVLIDGQSLDLPEHLQDRHSSNPPSP